MLDPFRIPSPILFRGNEQVAYRDPAIYHDGKMFHLFFTYVDNCPGGPYLHLAKSTSEDLIHWESPRLLTERNKAKNYSSPGNIIRFRDRYVLCLQTYPRENGEKYGACAGGFISVSDGEARIVATTFEFAEDIDVERAKVAKEKAQNKLNSDKTSKIAEIKLKKALLRLEVSESK